EPGVSHHFSLEEVGLDISGCHHSARDNALRKPESHRSAACADLKTTPSGGDTQTPQVLARPRVECRLQPGKPFALLCPGVVIRVALRQISSHPRGTEPTLAEILP